VSAVYLQQFAVIRTTISKKSSFLRTPAFIFCLPWERPCGNHAKRCMNEKTIQCLPNSSQYVPIYLQQFLSYSNRKCKISQFSRTAAHIFVSPGDAPAIITQHVAWMERQFNACQTPCGMYSSIFNSFSVIRTASAKYRSFHVPQPTFLFPLETPLRLSHNMLHGWKDNSMLVKLLAACVHLSLTVSQLFEPQVSQVLQNIAVFTYRSPRFCFPWRRPCDYHAICCMYLSMFNSFRVIRCLSQSVSRKIAIFTTFLFPLGTPLEQSR